MLAVVVNAGQVCNQQHVQAWCHKTTAHCTGRVPPWTLLQAVAQTYLGWSPFAHGQHTQTPIDSAAADGAVLCLQVLRVLITVMSDFGPVPLARRLPSITLGAQAAVHMQPLAEQAVVSLQVRPL